MFSLTRRDVCAVNGPFQTEIHNRLMHTSSLIRTCRYFRSSYGRCRYFGTIYGLFRAVHGIEIPAIGFMNTFYLQNRLVDDTKIPAIREEHGKREPDRVLKHRFIPAMHQATVQSHIRCRYFSTFYQGMANIAESRPNGRDSVDFAYLTAWLLGRGLLRLLLLLAIRA